MLPLHMQNKQTMKTLTKQQIELKEKLNPVIEVASKMLLGGTLKKNVVRYFENKGFTSKASLNILEMAEIRASKLSYYKFK